MSRYVVTVKFDRNPAHNPNRKVTGPCPLSEQACTDRTGAHHSTVVDTVATVAEVRDWFTQRGIHVTRIETVAPEVIVTDAMVNAARDAAAASAKADLAAYFDGERPLDARASNFEAMRAAIAAALRAQRNES
jgi:hypothetical protein